jgi:tRNA threonylcarbamoyladenosine biosynthesis protein TsaE
VSASPRSQPLVFESASEDATEQLAAAFSRGLVPGDVVALNGPLGAGKTRLVRGLAAALGSVQSFVSSPTFGLVQQYDGEIPLVHIDAYRLRDSEEFEQMGGRDLFDPEAVTLIEWAERIMASLPSEHWDIRAEHVSPSARRYRIDSTHRDRESRLKLLETAFRKL